MDYNKEHKSLSDILLHHFAEEMEDACEYAHLAEEYPAEAEDFWAIGREEVTHAHHLKKLLDHHGHEFSDEHIAKWHKILHKYGFEK